MSKSTEKHSSDDFAPAALSANNKQPAGSGGPFDPANTSLAHMTEHQRMESLSPGHPTTGGMTPKLTPANLENLSERDREAALAIAAAKTPEEKSKTADMGTGIANPATAAAINADQKARAKQPTAAEAKKAADAATARAAGAAAPTNQEVGRLEREKAQHDEAVRISAEVKKERGRAPAAKKSAPKKMPAKKAARKPAAPAKKGNK